MARVLRETRQIITRDEPTEPPTYSPIRAVARVVNVIATLIIVLLAFRFLFALLGANKGNAITDFVYVTSQPLVAPFFGMFNFKANYGVSTFELETLIAMVVYALIAWAIVYLLGTDE